MPAPDPEIPWWIRALRATLPSTVGIAALSFAALAFSPILAAVIAGMNVGLALGGVAASFVRTV